MPQPLHHRAALQSTYRNDRDFTEHVCSEHVYCARFAVDDIQSVISELFTDLKLWVMKVWT